MQKVVLQRLESQPNGLLVSFTFDQPTPPARVRFLLNVEGLTSGEASTGAEFMLEGTTWHSLVGERGEWNWTPLAQVPVISDGNTLHFMIEDAPALMKSKISWLAQITSETWEVVDRYPKSGMKKETVAKLPVRPLAELKSSPAESALDIDEVQLYRLKPKGLAVRVQMHSAPDPARIRVLLDLDGPDRGEPSSGGADVLVEGTQWFKSGDDNNPWVWDSQGAVASLQRDRSMIYLLSELDLPDTVDWIVETTRQDWSPADRVPVFGKKRALRGELPFGDFSVKPKPVDLSELLQHLPPSLSPQFVKNLEQENWVDIPAGNRTSPSWLPRGATTSIPLVFSLKDVVTGDEVKLVASRTQKSNTQQRWGGEALGVTWDVLAMEDSSGDLQLTGRIHAEKNRCIRLGVGARLDLVGWTWHDDFRFRRLITRTEEPYRNTGPFPFGSVGAQSLYPFGVISRDDRSLIVETDPNEARVCQIYAESEHDFFGVYYDLGLSPETKKFPGAATFRMALRSLESGGASSFRRSLSAFYDRFPDFNKNRTGIAGLWMPFSDISKIPQAKDFGFAFFEKGLGEVKDPEFIRELGVLSLPYTEPWLHWLGLTREMGWNEEAALRQMEFLSKNGEAQVNQFSAASLLGAARTTDQKIRMRFLNTPWSNGARMEVSTDPELPTTEAYPVNRAMAEWDYIQKVLEDGTMDGIYLDSMSAMEVMNYDPRALSVTDLPPTFAMKTLQPGLATPLANIKFTVALSRYLHSKGKFLMANFPCWNHPFFMPYIDIPGEETSWYAGGQYKPMSALQLNFRRAISGQKAFGFLQATYFDKFKGEVMERYFKDCLFYAFQPSFFSKDGANDPYWENPEWLERDRHLFTTYMPFIQRLGVAGWQPQGPVSVQSSLIWGEHFGRADDGVFFLTIRNDSDTLQTTDLILEGLNGSWVCYDPFSGRIQPIHTGSAGKQNLPTALSAHNSGLRVFVRSDLLSDEIAFLKTWRADGDLSALCVENLVSVGIEQNFNIEFQNTFPTPSLANGVNEWTAQILNKNSKPLRLKASKESLAMKRSTRKILPGETAILSGSYRASDVDAEGRIRIVCLGELGGTEFRISRSWIPLFSQPVEIVHGATDVFTLQSNAVIDLTLYNHMKQPIPLRLEWSGGGEKNTLTGELGPLESRKEQVLIPISSEEVESVQVSAFTGDDRLFDETFQVTKLPEGSSLARDSRVRVTADSTFSGYSLTPLTDGIVESEELSWNEAAWATEDTSLSHWVRVEFPEAQSVSNVVIHWNVESEVTYASKRGEIRGRTESGEQVILASFENEGSVENTHVTFEPFSVKTIELFQPGGGGSEDRPNLMWLRELEVH